jgi:hypothetical protein
VGMKKQFALGVIALMLAQFPALPSQAESCEGDLCEVTFNYSGEIVAWQVPAGVNQINFELAGASGGRGGQGGKVTGSLTDLPETLYFAVGGIGKIGSQVAGGFNGGGTAGGFRTNEGSGGGASDIRFGLELSDRVVVAGGGGGGGGFSGAPGGPGGGLEAAGGQSGQGGGGLGGTQTQGGAAGLSNGGTEATAGQFGIGGAGGSVSNAGGGGGGGGWYGGGGGGADQDNCCTDGGGGGGGSSYADTNYTLDIVHEAGVQLGDGYIRLSYQKEQSLLGFSGGQQGQSIEFVLELTLPQTLAATDFDLAGLSCTELEFVDQSETQRVIATGCEHGFQQLAILHSTVGGSGDGQVIAGVLFDALAPEISWEIAAVDHLSRTASINYSLTEGEISPETLNVLGCESVVVSSDRMELSNCNSENVEVTVFAGSISDAFGNLGPESDQTLSIELDLVKPEVSFVNLVTDRATGSHQVEVSLSEPANLDLSQVVLVADQACDAQFEVLSTGYLFFGSCGSGSYQYLIPKDSVIDQVGNLGPSSDVLFSFSIEEPVQEVIEEEASVTPEPQDPELPENSEPETVQPEEEPETQQPENLEPETTEPASSAPVFQEPVTPPAAQQPASEPEVITPEEDGSAELVESPVLVESPPARAEPDNVSSVSEISESASELPAAIEISQAQVPEDDKVGLNDSSLVREPTDAEKLSLPLQEPEELAQPVFAPVIPEAEPTAPALPNLWWLGVLGVVAVGLSGLFGYRLIGK